MECKWKQTAGARKLRRFLSDARLRVREPGSLGQAELAERLGTKANVVYAWTVGFRRPGHEFRMALERIAGIRPDDWLTSKERADLSRVRAA